jgi:autotransporter-associated beta strand protein
VLSVNTIAPRGTPSALGAGSTITLGDAATHGTLQYTGGGVVSTDRSITLNAGGGTIEQTDVGGLLTLSGVISGPGGLTTKGGGSFAVTGANTYTGPTLIGTGTLVKPGADTSLGSGPAMITVESGATLDVNGRNLSAHPVTISGTGYQDQGALINNGPDQQNALNKLILAGDATVSGAARFDIRAGTNPTLDLQGHKLTKMGAKQFSLVNTMVTAGDIDVNEGTLSVELGSNFTGAGTITVNSGATLGVYGNTPGAFTRNVTLAGGTLNNLGSAATVDARINLAQDTFNTISTPTTTAVTVLNGGLQGNGTLLLESAVQLNTKPGDHIGGSLTNNASTISVGGSNVGTFTTDAGLTLNGGKLIFDLSGNPASGNDQMVIGPSGNLQLSGTTTIQPNLINGVLGNGTYTLISGPSLASGDVSNLALSFGATRQTVALDTSTSPGSVLLKVSGNTASLVWTGNLNTGAWDVNTTQNWVNGANPDVFFNLDAVKFDNSSTNGAVVLNTAIAPQSVTFDNSTTNYTFTGTGTIGGSGAVVKNGTGTVTYSQKQTYTGGTTVNAGTLVLTVGGSQGALNGVLTVNPGATVQSSIKDSFGYGGGTNQVNVLNVNGGTVSHTSNDNLTLWAEQINMTGGVLQATGGTASQLDFGNGSVLNVLASTNVATIAGNKFNMRQDVNLITVADGAAPVDLLVSAPITSDTATRGLTKAGPGTMVVSSTSTYGGPTTVNGGTLSVSGSIAGSSGVTVGNASAVYEAASTQRLKALTVTAGQARVANGAAKQVLTVGDGTSATSTLNLTGGKLDVGVNGLVVDYATSTPAGEAAVTASVRSQIIAGLGAGKDWQGTTGITSTDAAAAASSRAIGYAVATDVLPFTAGNTDTFMGATVDKTSVVARYTLAGDATLDGTVDFNDLVKLAQNYNTTVSATTEGWWSKGDFMYDGVTDFNDLVKLAQNYNTALPTQPVPGASAAFEADLARAFASVPEPGTLSILGIGGIALMGRRRRRSR